VAATGPRPQWQVYDEHEEAARCEDGEDGTGNQERGDGSTIVHQNTMPKNEGIDNDYDYLLNTMVNMGGDIEQVSVSLVAQP
jgi:hypothetical protein